MRAEFLAETIAQVIASSVGPLLTRVNAMELKTAGAESIRDRLQALEITLEMGRQAVQRDLAIFGERLAVVENRPPMPGPPGPAGSPGLDGKDGAPGLRYCGVWVDGKTYDLGDLATWGGSTWHCNAIDTRSKPGDESKAWTMMVKAGRDVGRDTRERGKP